MTAITNLQTENQIIAIIVAAHNAVSSLPADAYAEQFPRVYAAIYDAVAAKNKQHSATPHNQPV